MSPVPSSLAALVALLALAQAAAAQPAPAAVAGGSPPGAVKLLGRSIDKKNELGKRKLAFLLSLVRGDAGELVTVERRPPLSPRRWLEPLPEI